MTDLRHDRLHDRWIAVAGDRSKRPKEFRSPVPPPAAAWSDQCPFCPGHEDQTPPETGRVPMGADTWRLRAIPNRFPIFSHSEVVIESPRHNAELEDEDVDVAAVLSLLQLRYRELRRAHPYVAVFRNRGPEAGASLRHPHSQLVATPVVPPRVAHEVEAQRSLTLETGECPWCRLYREARPLWAAPGCVTVMPPVPPTAFALWLIPGPHGDFGEAEGLSDLAVLLRQTLIRLDRVLGKPPYNLMVHTAPAGHDLHWHLEIIPRLGTYAGFELATGFMTLSMPPEEIEKRLREAE